MPPKFQVLPRIRVLRGEAIALGPGKADILEAVAETGSITRAARRLGMSYKRAWDLVETMNAEFREPLVETRTGGERGGGALLTRSGERALRLYRAMERKALKAMARDAEGLRGMMK